MSYGTVLQSYMRVATFLHKCEVSQFTPLHQAITVALVCIAATDILV